MIKFLKRFVNRREIRRLKMELDTLEFYLSSMEDKLEHSRSVAATWQEQVKTIRASESEKKASLNYYREEVNKDEEEISQLKRDINKIKRRLFLLGY